METIGILGAGAWGTALALVASRAGKKVLLQAREQEVIDAVRQNNENTPFLPGVPLNPNISVTNSFEGVLSTADVVLLVIPAQFLRASCKSFSGFWKSGMPAVVCAKGIEQRTGALMSEILAKELPQAPIAVLSGPTFAAEAALEKPTAVTLACADKTLGKHLVETLGTLSFRPYYSSDIISVEIGGAVKNVMAIAAGIVEGKKLGDNARAALITRGLAEISRLAVALGGKAETLMGLSGLGDLVLTANSTQSRNYSVGLALGEGKSLNEILSNRRSVAEGVYTAEAVVERARAVNVEMPICEGLMKIMNENVPVDDVLYSLLSRPFKPENA